MFSEPLTEEMCEYAYLNAEPVSVSIPVSWTEIMTNVPDYDDYRDMIEQKVFGSNSDYYLNDDFYILPVSVDENNDIILEVSGMIRKFE